MLTNDGLFEPNVVEDRELITGQNRPSDRALTEVFLKALDRQTADKGSRVTCCVVAGSQQRGVTVIFQVEINIAIPDTVDRDMVRNLSKEEGDKARELQRSGKWKHLWRVVGKWSNLSVFDVESAEELHEILTSLPLYRFMTIRVTPLCRHPASVEDLR